MDRFQTVNGGQDTMHPFGTPDLRPPVADDGGDAPVTTDPSASQFGACLYLGPQGKRCYKSALASGFCANHSPSATAQAPMAATTGTPEADPARKRTRAFAAILGLLGVLWPVISEVLRALLSFLHRK